MTTFWDVIKLAAAENEINVTKKSVAHALNEHESTFNNICKGTRNLTRKVAQRLTRYGGTEKIWFEIFDETRNGSSLEPGHFVDLVKGKRRPSYLGGRYFKRLIDSDITELFDPESDFCRARDDAEDPCYITDFSQRSVNPTSYDAVAAVDSKGYIDIEAGSSELVVTREFFAVPSWMEVDVHPPTSMSQKGLIIANGPIIDPGWRGKLSVFVFNPGNQIVSISGEEPFLTLRFSIMI